MTEYRLEKDALGEVKVPKDAYYGPETQRALDNFTASGLSINHRFIISYAMLKKAAAIANMKIGKLDKRRCHAISKACDEVINGKFSDQFSIDVFQAGAGTCINMNLNEVIANRAIEILGGEIGDYKIVHPNDHVNMSQSTNDTFHTTIHLSAYLYVTDDLIPALDSLEVSLTTKAREFSKIIKIGRTHLQEAVPLTLGQEFSGYAGAVSKVRENLEYASSKLLDIPLGGTAVGTMLNASDSYSKSAIKELSRITKCKFKRSKNLFASQQNQISELLVADAIKETAVAINKIANDFRLLASGPRAGIGEILLPEVQPGSSIMPGKVNPSMPEMMNMICMQAIGCNTAITEGANSGQLELNVFMPLIAFNLMFSIQILSNGLNLFTEKCVNGIAADTHNIERHLNEDLSLATALNPYIGYAKAAEIVRKAYVSGKTIKEVCLEMRILDKKRLDELLDPKNFV